MHAKRFVIQSIEHFSRFDVSESRQIYKMVNNAKICNIANEIKLDNFKFYVIKMIEKYPISGYNHKLHF